MKHAQKPDHINLNGAIARLKEGRYVVPDFQREFEWRAADIRDLMRSILLDYYIGSLLLWKGKPETFEALSCEPIYGVRSGGNPEHIVLDGQQRLTAIYYACVAPDKKLPRRANRYLYFVHVDRFMREDHEEAFYYEWTKAGRDLLGDRTQQFERLIFPFATIGSGGFALPMWIVDCTKHWEARAGEAKAGGDAEAAEEAQQTVEEVRAFGDHLQEVAEQFQVSFIELDRDLELFKVCDIFTKINSKGVALDVFDLLNAMLKPKGVQLKKMWRQSAGRLSFVGKKRLNVYVLQVMSIGLQAYCSPRYLYFLVPGQEKRVRTEDGTVRPEVLVDTSADFEQRWGAAVDALERSIEVLRHPHEYGVSSARFLPYVSILPVFAALNAMAANLSANHRFEANRKIRLWYWASVFTNRYSGSVESKAARDYLDVRAWVEHDDPPPAVIDAFRVRVGGMDFKKDVKVGGSVYNGVFNLLVMNGARDWVTGAVPLPAELDDHHIVPQSWCKKQRLGKRGDTILNRTPLTAVTNREVIGKRLPNVYLPDLIAQQGEQAVRSTLASHFISPAALKILLRDPFTPDDFEIFLSERRRTIQVAIETLLVKQRIDMAPELRDLDEQIEAVELRMRDVVKDALEDDPKLVPGHVTAKVKARTAQLAKRSSTFNREHYTSLTGQLEFFDLSELQDTIVSKPLWDRFAGRFLGKETLATKFSQLAALRNGIRHSRSVDGVVRKEGEAAILWFDGVLEH